MASKDQQNTGKTAENAPGQADAAGKAENRAKEVVVERAPVNVTKPNEDAGTPESVTTATAPAAPAEPIRRARSGETHVVEYRHDVAAGDDAAVDAWVAEKTAEVKQNFPQAGAPTVTREPRPVAAGPQAANGETPSGEGERVLVRWEFVPKE